MVLFASIISFIVAVLIWILFTPVRAQIDTARARFEISQRGTLLLAWHPDRQPSVEVRVLGFNVPISTSAPENRPQQPKRERKKRPQRSLRAWSYLVEGCVKSVRLRELTINVDTDDVVLNAKLIPLAAMLSRGALSLSVNFQGDRYLRLDIECRPSSWLWTFLVFLTIK